MVVQDTFPYEGGFVPYGACGLQPYMHQYIRRLSGFVPYGACGLQLRRSFYYESKEKVSSPTGRVGCNQKLLTQESSCLPVSSPTGRVGCNGGIFICYKIDKSFVPYGACGLQPIVALKGICTKRFRPLRGVWVATASKNALQKTAYHAAFRTRFCRFVRTYNLL